ncbi:hypothetical protein SAMN07250955_11170 [Arboricoccus pini]|uniref:Holin-X, holin superfamily III n=1 Tax=Arboricoccus pini TaxID=1963835 RepID=A0A212RNE9_9PROT|nr:hypothetical protein [Arboricoccus pini]SNB74067.1 hypothetical protein SAMN07250955_11170 [Arboricoccus pini]
MVAQAGYVSSSGMSENKQAADEIGRQRAADAARMGLIVGIPGGPVILGVIMGLAYLLVGDMSAQMPMHLLFMSVMLMPFTLLAGAGIFALIFYLVQRAREARRALTGASGAPDYDAPRGGLFLEHVLKDKK